MPSARKGFAQIIIVAIVALTLGAVGILGYQKYAQKPTPTPTPASSTSGQTQITSKTLPSPIASTSGETVGWKTYSDGKVSFKYLQTWDPEAIEPMGSVSNVHFNDRQGVFVFDFTQRGNYNNGTGKPFADLYEYVNTHQVAELTVGGQPAIELLPRAGYKDTYVVNFFSKDNKSIYTLGLGPKNRTPDRETPENEEKIFNQILSTFKFTN